MPRSSLIQLLIIILCCRILSVQAETYKIDLQGSEIKSLSAIEVKFDFNPRDSFTVSEDFEVKSPGEEAFLFKTVDKEFGVLRVFFANPPKSDHLVLQGHLDRANFTGDSRVLIGDIKFISDFANKIDSKKIKMDLVVSNTDDILPYAGITKAEILGPSPRIYSKNIFVAIGNMETYGFDFQKPIKKLKVNGFPAKLLHRSIIAAMVEVPEMPDDGEIDINVEFQVGTQLIQKRVGTLKLIEAI